MYVEITMLQNMFILSFVQLCIIEANKKDCWFLSVARSLNNL